MAIIRSRLQCGPSCGHAFFSGAGFAAGAVSGAGFAAGAVSGAGFAAGAVLGAGFAAGAVDRCGCAVATTIADPEPAPPISLSSFARAVGVNVVCGSVSLATTALPVLLPVLLPVGATGWGLSQP